MTRILINTKSRGFTLVELLITVLVSSVVAGGIYAAFRSQNKTYLDQEAGVNMQQNLRQAMDMMMRDIRLAGYDFTGDAGDNAALFPKLGGVYTVTPGSPSRIHMTMDLNADKDTGDDDEDVAYGFSTANWDTDDDGIVDPGVLNGKVIAGTFRYPELGRDTGSGYQPMAENIQAVAFAYAYDNDDDGNLETYTVAGQEQVIWAAELDDTNDNWENLDTDGDGGSASGGGEQRCDGPGVGGNGFIAGVDTGTKIDPTEIKAVRVWCLAKAGQLDTRYTDSRTHVVGNKVITPNDNFRRRLLEVTVHAKNQ